MLPNKALFLDRDGIINRDVGIITTFNQFIIMPGVGELLNEAHQLGFMVIVITNQTALARGLLKANELDLLHEQLNAELKLKFSTSVDAFYICPHHPDAQIDVYKKSCDCRKPKPGLLLKAASDHQLDLTKCFFVGDRQSDIAAGFRAGVKTILLNNDLSQSMNVSDAHDPSIKPDYEIKELEEIIPLLRASLKGGNP